MKQKPIIVTGTHRSGSTWFGKMLALTPNTCYINEPFTPIYAKAIMGLDINWFHYLKEEELQRYYGNIKNGLGLSYTLVDLQRQIKNANTSRKKMAFTYRYLKYHILDHKKTPIIKDPMAVLSLEQLAKQFDLSVVCIVRHPAAFIASLKRVDWTIELEDWIGSQPLLIQKHFKSDWEAISNPQNQQKGLIWRASHFWRLVNKLILSHQSNNPTWRVYKHEELSADPLTSLEKVYADLGLDFNDQVRNEIKRYTGEENKKFAQGKQVLDLKRNSKELVKVWKGKLSPTEIAEIKHIVGDVSIHFYGDDEW